MRHFPLFSHVRNTHTRLSCGLGLSLLFVASGARGDAFSAIAANSPIYRQLSLISSAGAKTRPATNLTRYEAALQVARVVTTLNDKSQLSRTAWRALRDLTTTFAPELTRLGLDTHKTLALCESKLDLTLGDDSTPDLNLGSNARPETLPFGLGASSPLAAGLNGANSANSNSATPSNGTIALNWNATSRISGNSQAQNANRALPFQTAASRGDENFEIARSNSVNYNYNSWLTFRASSAKRRLGLPDQPPALQAPLFEGAREAVGVGGGLDLNLTDNLRFSTDLESLSTDTGQRGTRVGGGVALSAFSRRLNLSANVSRLTPESAATLPSTSAQLGASVGLSDKLSLRLFYQGLFTQQNSANASRIGGGASVSF